MYNGPIIDAHFHYFNIDGFVAVARSSGYRNTAACWQEICQQNEIRVKTEKFNEIPDFLCDPDRKNIKK